ncbi:4-(cytidine 5'-diphospho)-2-C-methyl-D-erythritol kinase [Ferruginibacter sp. SUN002]|uniref:4-(cytidine 5'-diphospho)-2-C-methyl-D-erythritol kinase n=1 Tax=Ferruginibacter sp. SUN002 TaxID=2937789 RepID=UPI003D3645FA
MVVFPNCKINLGLRILDKRADGFHNLATIFYPIKLNDALEVIKFDKASTDIEFTSSGNIVDVDIANNICVKAYHLLKKDIPQLPSVKMHLHKSIPMGAGLGGGSADGAFALQLLNTKFQLGLSPQQLSHYALQLGSDCPFFILNKPCIASGRGEVLQPIDLNLSGKTIVVINPGIHINTGWAFGQLSGNQKLANIDLDPSNSTTWKNDFEPVVFKEYPEIEKIKEHLYSSGAFYASMSGSGSTVFGLFSENTPILPQFPAHYYLKTIQI